MLSVIMVTTHRRPTFGNRYASDQQMNKMAMPGPGTYHAPESFGKQVRFEVKGGSIALVLSL